MAHQTRALQTDEANSSALHSSTSPLSYWENLGRVVTVKFSDAVDVRADSGSTGQRSSHGGSVEAPGRDLHKRRTGIVHGRPPILAGIKQFNGPASKSESSLSDTSEVDERDQPGSPSMSSSSSMTLTPAVTSQSESDAMTGDEEDDTPEAGVAQSTPALPPPSHVVARLNRGNSTAEDRPTLYPNSAIPEVNYPSNDYATSPYPVYEFPDSTFPSSAFPSTDFPTVSFPASSFPKSEFPDSKLPSSDFPTCEFPSSDFPTS